MDKITSRLMAVLALPALAVQLSGCASGHLATAETTGIVVGGTVGASTGSPLLGLGAGLLSSWGVTMGFEHYELNQQAKIQRIIADVAGDTALGESNAWAQGRLDGVVEVSRVFGKRPPCKEVVYTVNWKKRYVHHVGTVCKAEERWEWAVPQARAKPWIDDPRPSPGESTDWE